MRLARETQVIFFEEITKSRNHAIGAIVPIDARMRVNFLEKVQSPENHEIGAIERPWEKMDFYIILVSLRQHFKRQDSEKKPRKKTGYQPVGQVDSHGNFCSA